MGTHIRWMIKKIATYKNTQVEGLAEHSREGNDNLSPNSDDELSH